MITTVLDVLGTLLIIAALAVSAGVAVAFTGYGVAVGLTLGGLLVLVFSWVLTKKGGKP